MTKKTQDTEADKPDETPIAVDSDEREGNDIPTLVGSGAPMVKIRAKANIQGLQVGQTGVFIQSEELRLQIQNGLAEAIDE